MRCKSVTWLVVLTATLCGCAGGSGRPDADDHYQTVGRDPHRDTELARRENERALGLIGKGDWPEAEKALKKALAADVTFGPAHNNLGKVYFHQGRLYLAAWEFEYAAKLMPHQPEPRNNLGLVFEAGGKFDEAVESYAAAMKIEPDNPQFIGNLARARVRRGDDDEQTRNLLAELVMRDTRPEWVAWARERLGRIGGGGDRPERS